MKPTLRSGFGLFQLLVVMGLLTVLLALFFPAIVKIREAAQRAQSQNNLKQIGIAVHNHADVNKGFPAGNDKNNFAAFVHLLPYIEQDNLYKLVDKEKSVDDDANAAVRKTRIQVCLSPLDSVTDVKDGWAPTNYVFSAGTNASLKDNNGMFYQDSKVFFPDITDGTSNTIMCMETLKGGGGNKAVDVRRQHVQLTKKALDGLKEDAGVDDYKNEKNVVGDRCASWMDGRFLQATANGARMPNDPRPDVNCEGFGGWAGPRSKNSNIIVGFGDGSVRSISDKIAKEQWHGVQTRNGGEAVSID